ncbi:alpha/beta hydrolase [Rhodocytophaga aerolata]|uniref:Alpha/beta hydrolase n=1 Tax=Rhodocytophaga aerolata TaxID=455078 RepID=A0ABT8R0X5_9BACT|nr:alpha/beta hydrolase [Rhodocytophaga aerolata]MDO1445739.1 alpha/beta hydrolase [Rhodocytophaga aerolata]
MKKYLLGLGILLLLLAILYLAGPKPASPSLVAGYPTLPHNLTELEKVVQNSEKALKTIKQDNQARIIWFDSLRKEKTPYSIVYLHGFGASQAEGAPVHTQLAKQFGCNLYLSRLRDHGVQQENVFADLTPENFLETAQQAIAVGKELGDSVLVIGTSTGGAFALYAASHDPSIKALVLYSPLIDFYSGATALIDKPWGLQLMRTIIGSDYMEFTRKDTLEDQYWLSKYRLEGLVALKSFVAAAMTEETFSQVKCPVFLGYYYKNEEAQDKVVSVPDMLEMYDQLATPIHLKQKKAFPEAGHHVIASYIRSKDYEGVRDETARFFQEVVHLKPVSAAEPSLSEMAASQ